MRFNNHCWYVSVEAPSKWRPKSSRAPFLRQTRGFPTEIEAKHFAKAVLSDEMKVTAGTLNPHLPKRRIIAATEIYQWVEEKEQCLKRAPSRLTGITSSVLSAQPTNRYDANVVLDQSDQIISSVDYSMSNDVSKHPSFNNPTSNPCFARKCRYD